DLKSLSVLDRLAASLAIQMDQRLAVLVGFSALALNPDLLQPFSPGNGICGDLLNRLVRAPCPALKRLGDKFSQGIDLLFKHIVERDGHVRLKRVRFLKPVAGIQK